MRHDHSIFGTPREWAIDLAVITAVGVFLGMIGPFGSFYGAGTEGRIGYWVGNMWIGFVILSMVVRICVRVGERLDLPAWLVIAAGVAIGAVPLSLIESLFSAWVWPPNHGRINPLFTQYGSVLIISEPFAMGFFFLGERSWRAATREAAVSAPRPANGTIPEPGTGGSFLARLPPRLGRDLLCLQMEDHYVRAHTDRGSDLVLTPLKDAIAELGDTDGLQVHRSWWVARAAVDAPQASGRQVSLRLTNGLTVPVSRASVAKLRAAGWLDGL